MAREGFGNDPTPVGDSELTLAFPAVTLKGDGALLSACSFSFSFGLGFMINRVADEAAMVSGAAIGFPPLPSRLRDGVGVFSGDAKPRGRTLALDMGDARYVE